MEKVPHLRPNHNEISEVVLFLKPNITLSSANCARPESSEANEKMPRQQETRRPGTPKDIA